MGKYDKAIKFLTVQAVECRSNNDYQGVRSCRSAIRLLKKNNNKLYKR
jgi:hypothetical protein